jgi:hypothetical protein
MRFVAVGVSGDTGGQAPGTETQELRVVSFEQHREDGGMRWRCTVSQQTGNRKQEMGLRLLSKPVQRAEQTPVVREGSTGRVVAVLPRVWAVAEPVAQASQAQRTRMKGAALELVADPSQAQRERVKVAPGVKVAPEPVRQGAAAVGAPNVELAFYRKYTEAMLRRYLRLSMEAGRVPSLLGREMFRGNVTSYRVHSFEDVVIFCFDVEKCLGKLERMDQHLIKRIALQQYTQGEAAGMLGLSLRNCIRMYWDALDKLTELLLAARMLEPLKSCQGGESRSVGVGGSF